MGPPGRFLVGFLALTEFFGGSCIMLVVIWREFLGLMSEGTGDFPRTPTRSPQTPNSLDCSLSLKTFPFPFAVLPKKSCQVVQGDIVLSLCLKPMSNNKHEKHEC